MHPLLNIGIQAARSASKIMLRHLDNVDSIASDEKAKNDFVTEVDRASENEIIQIIKKAYPDHSILAEESGKSDGTGDYTWVIDPLDGTINYMHGFPQFCISIAVKHKDQYEVGLIYDPIRHELFTAVRGQGAQLDNRRIRVSSKKKFAGSLIGTGFPFKQPQHLPFYMRCFETILPQTSGIRRAGAGALDLAYVAAGRLDGFWEIDLNEWDMAAGVLMIQEAGGMVSDFHGEKEYYQTGNLIAGTPKICQAIQDVVAKAMKE